MYKIESHWYYLHSNKPIFRLEKTMKPSTKIILSVVGVFVLIGLSVFATLGIQAIHAQNNPPPAPAPIVVAAPAPPAPLMAQVLSVQPHYVTTSTPSKSCQEVPRTVYQKQQSNVPGAGLVLGGVAGGLAGSAIHGNAHTAAIVAGSALGAVSGHAIQQNMNQPVPRTIYVPKCTTHTTTKKVQKGYEVTYVYNGQQATMLMDAPPPVGGTMPLPYQPAAPTTAPVTTVPATQPAIGTVPAQ